MIEEIEERLSIEIGRVRGNLNKLWSLLKAKKLNRHDCLNTLEEIDKSYENIRNLVKIAIVKILQEENEKLVLANALTKAFGSISLSDVINQELESSEIIPRLNDLEFLCSYLENPKMYSDVYVKRAISDFYKSLDKKLANCEIEIGKKDMLSLSQFTSSFPQFTPHWLVATIYLTCMEICVKKELKKRGKKLKESFKENVRLLHSCLERDGVEIAELEKLLPSVFWDLRNRVIHEGYAPTDDELKTITEYIARLIEKLNR